MVACDLETEDSRALRSLSRQGPAAKFTPQDRLIIATAVPAITDQFHSEDDIGWYGSAYLLTTCAFQLLFGKVYGFYSVKYTFLACIILFEIGSALCGAAPSSTAFIVGRAVAGIGAAGLLCGVVSYPDHCLHQP